MLTLDKIYHASFVLKEVLRRTDLIAAPQILPGTPIFLKPENLQLTGSFKVRGAYYKISQLSDEEKAKEMTRKLRKAEFTYDDFLENMNQVKNMGNVQDLLSMIPGMGSQLKNVDLSGSEAQIKRTESIILSMTKEERANPDLINPSRKKRIAAGAGVSINDVNQLVKQFDTMKKLMKQFSGKMTGKAAKRGRFKFPF